jgi:antitoxin (DNA-binding transcriptional repressor) of toxin-antitoxin stability system
MKHVNLSDARAHIGELLDEVERGETLMISREGGASENAPASDETTREMQRQAVRDLMEMRKTAPRATVEEILQWRDEGRRY